MGTGPAEEAFEAAVGALARKELTRAELATRLRKRGFDAEAVELAIERLADIGEIDDARFARRYAEDKRQLRGWGTERIRETLRGRGVAGEDIEEALRALGGEAEVESAVELLARRADGLDSEAARSRALGFLARRGYDSETAYEAIRIAERTARAA
jgi:regulatory protein